jgi:flagellar protein FlaG
VPLGQGKTSSSPDKADLSKTVDKINELIQGMQRELQFSVDDASGRTVVTVRDSRTREVIRQIPSEEVLAMAERLKEQSESNDKLTGILVQREA